jgi:hypothetical protein
LITDGACNPQALEPPGVTRALQVCA